MEIIMEERRVDLRIPNPERSKEGKRTTGILHRFNAADPLSVEYQELMKELFTGRLRGRKARWWRLFMRI